MYTATSIDVFIAAFAGAMGSFNNAKVPNSDDPTHYARVSNAALAYAEEFDTIFAVALPNDLQLSDIESISGEVLPYPNNNTTAFIPGSYLHVVNAVIAMMSENSSVIAANVTNPIPVPTPVSQTVLTIATVTGVTNSLKATTPTTAVSAIVEGYYAGGDGGGGNFFWNPTSAAVDNGGTIINPTAHVGNGRWIRIYSGAVEVLWFGAKFNSITDDTVAIQNAIDFVKNGQLNLPNPIGSVSSALLTASLVFDETSMTLHGPGASCLFQWEGAAGQPMFLIRESQNAVFEGFGLRGKTAAQPSYGIEVRSTGGDSPFNSNLMFRNIKIGDTSGQLMAIGFGVTGTNSQGDQSYIVDVHVENVSDCGFTFENEQNTGWVLINTSTNSAAYGIRSFTRWLKVLGVFYSSITNSAIHLQGDGNIEVDTFGCEGCVRFLRGTGNSFYARNGYFQSDSAIIPVDNAIVNVTTGGFRFDLEDVEFNRTGVFAPGQEQIKISGTIIEVNVANKVAFRDDATNPITDHLTLAGTTPGGDTIAVDYSRFSVPYFNYGTNGVIVYTLRTDVRGLGLRLSNGARIDATDSAGVAHNMISQAAAGAEYVEISYVGKTARALDNFLLSNTKALQFFDSGGTVRNAVSQTAADRIEIGYTGVTSIVIKSDLEGVTGADINLFRRLLLNQAISSVEFTETAHQTHTIKANGVALISVNDNAGATGGMGFFTTGPQAKGTVTGALVDLTATGALKSLLTVLATYGLLVDSSS